jgi:hypothetical protein
MPPAFGDATPTQPLPIDVANTDCGHQAKQGSDPQ